MRLVSVAVDGVERAGVELAPGRVLDLAKAAIDHGGAAGEALRSANLQTIIEAGLRR